MESTPKYEIRRKLISEIYNRYISKINAILNEYLAKYEVSVKLGRDFCYCDTDNTIHYALVVPEKEDVEFKTFIESLKPNFNYNDFIMGIFHELGHHHTLHIFEEWEIEEYQYNRCNMTSEEYFRHPIEMEATVWAIDYIEHHTEEVKTLWKKVQPLILDYYDALEKEKMLWV